MFLSSQKSSEVLTWVRTSQLVHNLHAFVLQQRHCQLRFALCLFISHDNWRWKWRLFFFTKVVSPVKCITSSLEFCWNVPLRTNHSIVQCLWSPFHFESHINVYCGHIPTVPHLTDLKLHKQTLSASFCALLCFSHWCRPISRHALGTFSQAHFSALGSYVYQLVCGKWSCFVAIAFLEFNRSGITTSILSHLQVSQCQICSDNRSIFSSKALIW